MQLATTKAALCHDPRAIQAYLGHRNIQHTVRYTLAFSEPLQ